MSDISLKISVEEANLVLEALGNLPFVKVHDLIRKIHQQASQQVQPPQSPTPEVSKASVANISALETEQMAALNTGADAQ